ncbi:MAG: hypothetical protein CM15mP109_08420 [Candidatus Dadabacteria bacterium]|nr:MAG: hypothetical protein CM15mP109_08420 [Candidatus Dadabacteria bacterium]
MMVVVVGCWQVILIKTDMMIFVGEYVFGGDNFGSSKALHYL